MTGPSDVQRRDSQPWDHLMPDPAEFERILREKYETILSAEDYARLRGICGLKPVIDGDVVVPPRSIEAGG